MAKVGRAPGKENAASVRSDLVVGEVPSFRVAGGIVLVILLLAVQFILDGARAFFAGGG